MGEDKPFLKLSVHQVVDFLLRQGDIDERIYNQETMAMGSLLHSAFQKKQGGEYIPEYYLSELFERKDGSILLSGRADGIIVNRDGATIDEIKSTVAPLDTFYIEQKAWHLGQAECYGLMYCHQKKLDKIGIRLTYISQNDNSRAVHEFSYSLKQLEEKVFSYLDEYLSFYQKLIAHKKIRNLSAANLDFPFEKFRPGQRELAKYCYGIARDGGILFAEAPTGIGKTMSTLFPYVKSFALGDNDKIFYLTAKTTGRQTAYEALGELYKHGLVALDSSIMAKDKLCFCPGKACNPDECPFAIGYYSKIRGIINEALSKWNRFDNGYVIELAKKHQACPFELQLDLSNYADVVIADYNYLFDPMVKLDRFFGEMAMPGTYIGLIDEAHNLIERGRMSYSSEIAEAALKRARKSLSPKRESGLRRALNKLDKALLLAKDSAGEDSLLSEEGIDAITKAMESLKRAHQKRSKEKEAEKLPQEYLDFYLEVNKCLKLMDEYPGGNSRLYIKEDRGGGLTFSRFCLDPSPYLWESLNQLKGVTLFSATLSPIDYYQDAITGSHDHPYLLLPSPFPKENFKLLLAPKVSVRYKDREKTYGEVAEYLAEFVDGKTGNYFLYFPSYEYLEKIRPHLIFNDAEVYVQSREMSELEREEFLANFPLSPNKTNIGLLVLGGAFSEGIDMYSDRLIGVALVGIGLPQIGFENNLIREYHQKKSGNGYEYAYMDPGMNKVMQAVGRLIRSESDVGAALLIDDRYMIEEYRSLFSRLWEEYEVVTNPGEVGEALSLFYGPKVA